MKTKQVGRLLDYCLSWVGFPFLPVGVERWRAVGKALVLLAWLPSIAAAGLSLGSDTFWEYRWSKERNTWAQGSSGSRTTTQGGFRLTLASPQVISGITFYTLVTTGNPPDGLSLCSHLGADSQGRVFGITRDTGAGTLLFDPTSSIWTGAGFLTWFATNVNSWSSTISNAFIQAPATAVRSQQGQSFCEYYPGQGTICPNDSSYTLQRSEFWTSTVGCLGMNSSFTYAFSGGGFWSGGEQEDRNWLGRMLILGRFTELDVRD